MVTAVGNGTCTITATTEDGAKTAVCTITVAITPGSDAPQTPGTPGSDAPQTPGTPGSDDPQTPGTPGSDAPQTPGTPGSDDPQTPGTPGSDDPQTPGTPSSDDPQTPVTPGPEGTQAPVTVGPEGTQQPATEGPVGTQAPATQGPVVTQAPATQGPVVTQAPTTTGTGTTDATSISAETLEKNVLNLNAGLKVSQTGSKINIQWGEVSEADGYNVYAEYCGTKFTSKSLNQVKSGKITKLSISKINGKKLNLKKNYKLYVVAYKLVDGKQVSLGKTITAHIVGRQNYAYTNVKAIKLKKSSYTLEKGKTATIQAQTVLVDKSKKQLTDAHAKQFRYASSDKKVATVSSKGKIEAVEKGTCTIYVYARNGYAKKIMVTVQ